ncbi:ABC transporter substrate-binding protein [Actinocrispum wychmicini]|uniref:ABC-type nitrate/sulfonate/bicarbonate transport system substrate-binding protein n=1 Tax=Actinocrispum wychmicini TaxID=1213861 RepID=A0A4R2IZB3_9PSEU|nr:ABC transporter substrate-binding protein [Actinocrispum wychmicini]TCO50647.1 ABC-type nitrate/sulfonate/bicarbonate transport system substrate-binding protein [Actinocrispum wychmicini]
MDTLRISTFSPSVLVEVATDTGLLAGAGLKVDEIPARSSPAQFAALLDGSLDAVVTNPDNVVAYRCVPDNPLGRNADVRILAAVDQGLGLGLYARNPEPHTKVLGVDVPTSGFAFVAFELLTRLGLRRDIDYTVRALGSTPRRAEALLSGQCDITILNAGNELRAETAGARRLATATTLGPYVGAVLAARGQAVQENRDVLAAFIRVLLTTSTDLVSGELVDVAVAAARRRLGLDEESAARHVRTMVDPNEGLVADGQMTPDALATVVHLRNRHSPGAAQLSVQSVVRSGIIDNGLLPCS